MDSGYCTNVIAAIGVATPNSAFDPAAAQFAFICIYICFFASTFGPAAWVVTGEMFPLKIRAKGLSMTTAANWFFNWLLSFITPYLTSGLEPEQSNVFWIWGSFCWIALVFTWCKFHNRSVPGSNLLMLSSPHLRDQGSFARASQRALRERIKGMEEPELPGSGSQILFGCRGQCSGEEGREVELCRKGLGRVMQAIVAQHTSAVLLLHSLVSRHHFTVTLRLFSSSKKGFHEGFSALWTGGHCLELLEALSLCTFDAPPCRHVARLRD